MSARSLGLNGCEFIQGDFETWPPAGRFDTTPEDSITAQHCAIFASDVRTCYGEPKQTQREPFALV